jgi:Domain of unknown function (DUF4249)
MMRFSLWIKKVGWSFAFFLAFSCVDEIHFDSYYPQFLTVVEGMISDGPGPYTIKLSKGLRLDSGSTAAAITGAIIKLFDDEGNSETLTENSPGAYSTNGIIRGKVGHSYYITVETLDGKLFQSEPDMIKPNGELEEIRYEFEARTVVEPFGEIRADVFNIYVDGTGGAIEDNLIRWRFKGTYKVVTNPELHMIYNPPYTPYMDPLPCSGWVLIGGPIGSGGVLDPRGPCECCTCWAKHYEDAPQLSDAQLITNNAFKNIKVGEVPISNNTFNDKYMVEVEQMSLTKNAFDFFKLIRLQKEGASNLFQPPAGEIKGNIVAMNTNDPVVGMFWATSIREAHLFIPISAVPYNLTPIEFIADDCRVGFPNSFNVKPENWE